MFQQMQSMAQKQVLKLFLPMSAYIHYTYIYNYYYSLSTYICITTTLIDDMLFCHAHPTYICTYHVSFVNRKTIVHTHLVSRRDARAHAYCETGSTLFYIFLFLISCSSSSSSSFFSLSFFWFGFLFLEIAAHCCDVVCLQSRELLMRCQWLQVLLPRVISRFSPFAAAASNSSFARMTILRPRRYAITCHSAILGKGKRVISQG